MAIARAQPALDSFRRHGWRGPGREAGADYGWYVFGRESLLREMAPQAILIPMTDQVAGWLLEVADWQRQIGEHDRATALCAEVLAAVPDNLLAEACASE